jgi:2-C-methyl-D-erythritol 2,4-cyclodiphosphate synthase
MPTVSFRIGHGVDIHRLVPRRTLILGGVEIPWDKGLLGHSDADVVCHALSNALLGAIGEGDIGRHFPDSDPRYKGAASLELLRVVMGFVKARGFRVGNVDLTILAEKPKLAPYREQMRQRLAEVLEVEPSAVNLKATTGEKMGFVGREEGMMAEAVVLLESRETA